MLVISLLWHSLAAFLPGWSHRLPARFLHLLHPSSPVLAEMDIAVCILHHPRKERYPNWQQGLRQRCVTRLRGCHLEARTPHTALERFVSAKTSCAFPISLFYARRPLVFEWKPGTSDFQVISDTCLERDSTRTGRYCPRILSNRIARLTGTCSHNGRRAAPVIASLASSINGCRDRPRKVGHPRLAWNTVEILSHSPFVLGQDRIVEVELPEYLVVSSQTVNFDVRCPVSLQAELSIPTGSPE